MRRFAVPLLIALMLAASAAAAQARPQRDPGIAPTQPAGNRAPATTASNDGPSWTVAVLAGVAVMLAFSCAGVLAGRASVRPQTD